MPKSTEFNKIIKSIKPSDLQFFEVSIFDGARPINLFFEEKDGDFIPMFGYNEGNFGASSGSVIKPLTQKQEEDLYEQVEKGLVQVEKVPKSKYANAGMKREVLIQLNPTTTRPALSEVEISQKNIESNKKMVIFKWRNNHFKYTSTRNPVNGSVITHIEKYDLNDKRFNKETGIPGMGANSEIIFNSINSDMNTGEGELMNKAIQGWGLEFSEKKDIPMKNFTPVISEVKGRKELKERLGVKKALNYFKQVDRLINPNENEIIEYRTNGVVVKEGDKYIFKALIDMDYKVWKIAEFNGRVTDVTDQFVKQEDIKNLHYKFPAYNPPVDLEKYTAPKSFTDIYPLTDSHLFHSEHGYRLPATLTYSDGKLEIKLKENRKEIEVTVNEIHPEGYRGVDNIEKRSTNLALEFFENEVDLNQYLLTVKEKFKSSYRTIDEIASDLGISKNHTESFDDCLKRNGINLEKENHKFEVGTIIKSDHSGRKYKVSKLGEEIISFTPLADFGKQSTEPDMDVTYTDIIGLFKEGILIVPGFDQSEVVEFARVLNAIQHCRKMDALLIEKEELKEKLTEGLKPKLLEAKFNINDTVYYLPKLSGFNNSTPLVINHKAYKQADDFTKEGWFYGFEGQNLSAAEYDLSAENPHKNIIKQSDGMVDGSDIDDVINAIKAAGLTDSDLKTPPTKTGAQYTKVKEKLADSILKKIQGVYKGRLKGNQPHSIILSLIEKVDKGGNVIEKKSSYISTDSMIDKILSKAENGGMLKSGKYSNSDSGVVAYIRSQKETDPNRTLILYGVNAHDIVKYIYSKYFDDLGFDYESKYGIGFMREVSEAISKIMNNVINPQLKEVSPEDQAEYNLLKSIFSSLKRNDKGNYIPSSTNDDKYIIKKAKDSGFNINVVDRVNDLTDAYDVYVELVDNSKTIAALKVLLSMETNPAKKKEIKSEIKKLS